MIAPNFDSNQNGAQYCGYIETASKGSIEGWCCSLRTPHEAITVKLFVCNEEITTATASRARDDLTEIFGFPVNADFKFDLKSNGERIIELAKDFGDELRIAANQIEIREATTNAVIASAEGLRILTSDLRGNEREEQGSISLDLDSRSGESIRGVIESFNDNVLTGWCLSINAPTIPVDLEVLLFRRLVGYARTTMRRVDLDNRLDCVTIAGFSFDFSECASPFTSEIIDQLKVVIEKQEDLRDHIIVRTERGRRPLSFMPSIRPSKTNAASILRALLAYQTSSDNNRRAAKLEEMLASMPVAEDLPEGVTADGPDDEVKLVAFYLPQYHPIPENNTWWGEGFTEWTNVSSTKPYFKDHYQPRIPADFGYYDLRVAETQAKQVQLAKDYGLSAFCYYYYWFSGTTLLTLPIDRHVEEDYDLDFCLCWANENWSRRWDGSDAEVLMEQNHVEANDVDFINSVIPYLAPRRSKWICYRRRAARRLERWRILPRATISRVMLFD